MGFSGRLGEQLPGPPERTLQGEPRHAASGELCNPQGVLHLSGPPLRVPRIKWEQESHRAKMQVPRAWKGGNTSLHVSQSMSPFSCRAAGLGGWY